MGNIRTSFVKRLAKELIETHKGVFTTDFEENKKLVVEIPEANILETNISSTNFLNGDKLPADEIVSARALCKKEILQKSAADMELKKAAKEQVKIILGVYYEKWAKSLGDGYKVEVK